jgi:ADP-heptose:LPS heptosyltransferase
MLFQFFRKFFSARFPKEVKHILVIREAAIGDVLCMTPFLKNLRKLYPHSKIDYVVVDWAKNAIETNPNIDTIYTVSNAHILGKTWKVALKRFWFYLNLSRRHYDLVFCPSTQLILKFPLIFFRTAYKVGFSTEPKEKTTKYNFMLDDYVYIDLNEIPRTRHIAVRNLEMLELISKAPISRNDKLEIFLSPKERETIDQLFERLGIRESDELIAIAAAAGSAFKSDSVIKTAPPEKFIEVFERLRQNSPNRKFFCIGAKSERKYVDAMNICDETHVFNVCGLLSLRESAELLRRCSLLISNDSGATHLASALGINHIVWFGATDDVEFGPYLNPNAVVYRVHLPCAPCRHSKCDVELSDVFNRYSRPYCLSMIDVEKVVELSEKKISEQTLSPLYFQEV